MAEFIISGFLQYGLANPGKSERFVANRYVARESERKVYRSVAVTVPAGLVDKFTDYESGSYQFLLAKDGFSPFSDMRAHRDWRDAESSSECANKGL